MINLRDWSVGDQPAVIYDMTVPGAWGQLRQLYAHRGNRPLERILEIAENHGVVSVLVERRYVDADWRSQLARFYNGTLRRFPSVCHRMHFFSAAVPDDLSQLDALQSSYHGYTVLRPFPIAPVGRTMIRPPSDLADAVRCEHTEAVDVFGYRLTITAMPFISQDTQLLRCAHAAVWMVLRHASAAYGLPSALPHTIFEAALGGVMAGRQLPNDGLSPYQLMAAMESLGLSPARKNPPQSRDEEQAGRGLRLYGMACRYINSSLPPIVISSSHAWVLVAYRRAASAGNPKIQLWRHDDARGPYLPVDDPWNEPEDAHQPWTAMYLPLLPKVYLDAERAETVGRAFLTGFRNSALYSGSAVQAADNRPEEDEQCTVRTFLMTSTSFKQTLANRGVSSELAAAYRRTPMSRYIWVVEIVDRLSRTNKQPDVLGEVILDSTLTQFEPLSDPNCTLAVHIGTFAFIPGIDHSPHSQLDLPDMGPYASACQLLPAAPTEVADDSGAGE
ncbi:MAG TPA: hypothetical protein VHD58_10890 [Mycobacteriales bacterium]|nr:hypothetical protein [Mycobacteriales bacterium]